MPEWMKIGSGFLVLIGTIGGYSVGFADRSYFPKISGVAIAGEVKAISENQKAITDSLKETNKALKKTNEALENLNQRMNEIQDDWEKRLMQEKIDELEKEKEELMKRPRAQ